MPQNSILRWWSFFVSLIWLFLSFAAMANDKIVTQVKHERIQANQRIYQLNEQMSLSKEKIDQLQSQVQALQNDQNALRLNLIKIAEEERQLEPQVRKSRERLQDLQQVRDGQMDKLSKQRKKLATILGFLEQFQRNPPPTLLVRPDDALISVRSAMLLGSLLPALQEQAKKIQIIVQDLDQAKKSVEKEYNNLFVLQQTQAENYVKLELLRQQQQQIKKQSLQFLQEEQAKIQKMQGQASSLKALISRLDAQNNKIFSNKNKVSLPQFKGEPLKLHSFSKPVLGDIILKFGEKDNTGLVSDGDKIKTFAGSVVTLPATGRILYAGSFRSDGQLLIVDLGQNYQLIMLGIGQLMVKVGEIVTEGEPVGFMHKAHKNKQNSVQQEEFVLYVELRKNGKAINIDNWWK